VKAAVFLLVALLLTGCRVDDQAANANASPPQDDLSGLRSDMKKVEPFFSPMGKPKRYDWLGSHNEPGQTFDQYLASNAARPAADRRKIYFLPLGKFDPKQQKVLDAAAGYLEAFYNLPVTKMPPRTLAAPTRADDRRRTPGSTREQIRTGYIMDTTLKPLVPGDAAALIAFTNVDLFADSSTSFVFGQANARDRVGIWSISRLGERANEATFLRRVLKIAVHETGHMFGFAHCTKYECVMSGTNYLGETDRRPIDACPECMAKVCWLTRVSPSERYRKLADLCRRNGLEKESKEFEQKMLALR
jgi:archaemetzincin